MKSDNAGDIRRPLCLSGLGGLGIIMGRQLPPACQYTTPVRMNIACSSAQDCLPMFCADVYKHSLIQTITKPVVKAYFYHSPLRLIL